MIGGTKTNIIHRFNSEERQHYLLEQHYSFKLKPRLLYAGELKKSGGWEENTHNHDFAEIVFVSDGHGEVTVAGQTRNIVKGDVIIYNAGVNHSEKSSEKEPLEFRFIAYDKLEITELPENHLLPPDYDFIYPCGDIYNILSSIFDQIILEFESKDQFYSEIAQSLSRTLIMYIFRLINKTGKESDLLQSNKVLDIATSYIDKNYSDEITLEALAAQCFVNKYYLAHLFTRFKGISFGKYLLDKRICEASNLLSQTTLSIGEIAVKTGFNDQSYFSRAFKKETGLTPLNFRKTNAKTRRSG